MDTSIRPIFRKGRYAGGGFRFKIFRYSYQHISSRDKPTREFEALFIKVGSFGFWVFRNQTVHRNWPSQM